MSEMISLRRLAVDQNAVVAKVKGGGDLGRRLREMGLVPGTRLRVVGRAPLKDPVEVKLLGYNLTLRNSEADWIFVTPEET